jgi:hypothetical protein
MCFFPSLTLVVFLEINIVRVRDSNLWRFLTKGTSTIRKKIVVSSGSLDCLKGVECNPRPLGRHNMEVGKCSTWPNHRIKIVVSPVVILAQSSTHLIIALSSILTL